MENGVYVPKGLDRLAWRPVSGQVKAQGMRRRSCSPWSSPPVGVGRWEQAETPGAAVTNHTLRAGLRHRRSLPRRPGGQKSWCLKALGEAPSRFFQILVAPGVPWMWPPHCISPGLHMLLFCPYVCLVWVSLIRTSVIGWRAHPVNPGRSHLETLVTSTKILLSNSVIFQVPGCRARAYLFVSRHLTHYTAFRHQDLPGRKKHVHVFDIVITS